MGTWQVQQAKSRFSELIDLARSEGPQIVTRHGARAVVVVSADDFDRMMPQPRLVDLLLNGPKDDEFADLIDRRDNLPERGTPFDAE